MSDRLARASANEPEQRIRGHWLGLPWFIWAAIGVPFFVHLAFAFRNVSSDLHRVVRPFSQLSGLSEWIAAYPQLFFKPETATTTGRLFAAWIALLIALSFFTALVEGQRITQAAGLFFAFFFAVFGLLAILTPTLWVVFGGWGPAATEFVPPLFLGLAAMLLVWGNRAK